MRFLKNSALKRRVLYSNDYKPIYITYYIVFPKGETWVNQVEFQNHDKSEQVSWEIDQMTFPIDIKNILLDVLHKFKNTHKLDI